ncbi:hypothetical protein HK102_006354, partial [Quaeritorhiza haematococci]
MELLTTFSIRLTSIWLLVASLWAFDAHFHHQSHGAGVWAVDAAPAPAPAESSHLRRRQGLEGLGIPVPDVRDKAQEREGNNGRGGDVLVVAPAHLPILGASSVLLIDFATATAATTTTALPAPTETDESVPTAPPPTHTPEFPTTTTTTTTTHETFTTTTTTTIKLPAPTEAHPLPAPPPPVVIVEPPQPAPPQPAPPQPAPPQPVDGDRQTGGQTGGNPAPAVIGGGGHRGGNDGGA